MKPEVLLKFRSYPADVRRQLMNIRNLILKIAAEKKLGEIVETLKWGEISYVAKGGSTVRVGWSSENPAFVKLFFHCQTSLVSTFKEIYPDVFRYESNRAILIPVEADTSQMPLYHCILFALRYHKVKHLPLLGA